MDRSNKKLDKVIMSKWVNTNGSWLNRAVDKEPNPIIKEEPDTKKSNFDKLVKTVIFVRPKCPDCGSKKAKWNGTDGNIRYYKCHCGCNFRAYEKEI